MKINVCYTVTTNIDMEVSDDFKKLEGYDFFREHESDWQALTIKLENIILDRLPENSEVLGVLDTDTHEIVYEN
jgi:hypothetical protein